MSTTLAERLRERILSGAVAPGQAIRQDTLAAEMRVSKIPLREALARLEEEGLLRSETNRGWFVMPMTAAEAREVYALRLMLEPAAAADAAALASAEAQGEARATLEALETAVAAHGPDVGTRNRAFHLALIEPAGTPVTFDIIERLHIISERYVREHLEPMGRDTRANAEHRMLIDAWIARDAKLVAALLRKHIAGTLKDLERQLRAN